MKTIAFYLPQFHEIEENNRAWGQGFTEWDNVKKATALFDGHYQPRVPLNHNYYNLLDSETMEWQISLAKRYGLYGFCFYHYWFRDGKRVLEKPAEMLLDNADLDIPFCFSWANEPWTKTWHGAAGEKEVLLEQRYGNEEQWKEHFEYLVPFFKDSRYITIDGRPVFLIYWINKISCFNRMIDYWNDLAEEQGIPSLYIIDMLTADGKVSKNKRVAASVDFEPGKGKRKKKEGEELLIQSYDEVCLQMLSESHKKNEYRCMFVDYDDTPRRGQKGNIFPGSDPEKFGMYLQKTIELAREEDNEYVFINAWNEWGEGNYLEPDERFRYGYLEALQNALAGKCKVLDIKAKTETGTRKSVDKFWAYYELCNKWIKLIYDGYKLEEYFLENGYHKIAVYGLGELGNRLIEALEDTGIQVAYGIDSNTWAAFAEKIDIVGFDEKESFDGVDCIVVTPVHVYKDVAEKLRKKSTCDVISLEDVITGL